VVRSHQRPREKPQVKGPVDLLPHSGEALNADSILSKSTHKQPQGSGVVVLSAYTSYLVPNADALAGALTVPASLDEFWMIGYLLIIGVRPARVAPSRTPTAD
jgi:hypothetical protein